LGGCDGSGNYCHDSRGAARRQWMETVILMATEYLLAFDTMQISHALLREFKPCLVRKKIAGYRSTFVFI